MSYEDNPTNRSINSERYDTLGRDVGNALRDAQQARLDAMISLQRAAVNVFSTVADSNARAWGSFGSAYTPSRSYYNTGVAPSSSIDQRLAELEADVARMRAEKAQLHVESQLEAELERLRRENAQLRAEVAEVKAVPGKRSTG